MCVCSGGSGSGSGSGLGSGCGSGSVTDAGVLCGRYRLAYVDNQLALSMDRNMDTVYASNNRISQHLKEQDGLNWRDKLPPHPDQQRVTQALNQQNSKDTAPQPPTSATTPPTSAPPPTQPSTATPPVSSAMPPPIMSSAATSLQTKVWSGLAGHHSVLCVAGNTDHHSCPQQHPLPFTHTHTLYTHQQGRGV